MKPRIFPFSIFVPVSMPSLQLVQYYRVTAVLCTATQPALQPLFAEQAPTLSIHEICPEIPELYQFFAAPPYVIAKL